LLLLALLVFFYRKSFRKLFISFYKKRKTSATDATRSIWRGESMMTAATSPDAPRSVYIPPRSMIQQPPLVSPLRLNPQKGGERIMSNIAVERQERLGLVRDLPPSKELDDIRARKEMNQELEDKGSIGLARGSGIVDEKDKVEIEASTGMWEESEIIAKRDSGTESEASLPRWRAPVSWVRDQRMRGWGRLSG
jgi:hypothetical protein